MKPKLISLNCIWDQAEHNGLTDLIYFQDHFFCCFRESNSHAGGTDGKIRILKSKDAKKWSSVALISKPGVDLRDPMLSQMPNGQLLLNLGGSVYKDNKLLDMYSRAAFSFNGSEWSEVKDVNVNKEWLWRVTWHKSIGYAASYRCTDLSDLKKPWILSLFQTKDGLHFDRIVTFDLPGKASETTLRFAADDTMLAFVRRTQNSTLGIAKPPYTCWQWFDFPEHLGGGPNFLILPNGELWGCVRMFLREKGKRRPRTVLGKFSLGKFKPFIVLPSDGDTGYPGMVYKHPNLYISYYSSHEGKALIYLAIIRYHPSL